MKPPKDLDVQELTIEAYGIHEGINKKVCRITMPDEYTFYSSNPQDLLKMSKKLEEIAKWMIFE